MKKLTPNGKTSVAKTSVAKTSVAKPSKLEIILAFFVTLLVLTLFSLLISLALTN